VRCPTPFEAACENAKWHRQTVIDSLVADGITADDATEFVECMFNEAAVAVDSDYIIDADIDDRLTIA